MKEYLTYRWKKSHRDARKIMELHLGRKLSIFEIVHHKDHNPYNNLIDNLQIMTREEHSSHHRSGRGNRNKPAWNKGKKINHLGNYID